MSSSDSRLLTLAKQMANDAVALDSKGHYTEAMNKYFRAAEILIEFTKYNKNPIMRQKCEASIEEYLSRARQIKSKLGGSRAHGEKASGSSGKSEDDKVTTGKGEFSGEEQELIDALSGTIVTESPDVKWTDIAGLNNCKQALREAIVLPMIKPELFKGPRKPWSGILLFGPPGCGKTLLAKAAATECKATFFSVSSADLLSKWLGESEKLISSLFKLARLKTPSLIFIDEIDSIATKRGEGTESGGERRVKTQLLSEIQGMKSTKERTMLVLGATNRPWDLDNAMLSRFEKKVQVPLPDVPARIEMFKLNTAGVNMALTDEDFVELAVRSEY
jgi:vacuolar protein-sorting-associated protein 4